METGTPPLNTKESPISGAILVMAMAIGIYIAILAFRGQASNKMMFAWIIPMVLLLSVLIYQKQKNKTQS